MDSRRIAIGGLAASFLVGLVASRYAQQEGYNWLDARFQRDGDIRIDSGKEGIQPKHNVKPKLLQVTG